MVKANKGGPMKINQVEELVGITKKNIRFYEEQGLISPGRNPANGYREYNLKDVKELERIRLLRQLEIPLEEIRRLQRGELSLGDCMEKQSIRLSHRKEALEVIRQICLELSESEETLSDLEPSRYFDEIKLREKGGARFMDVRKADVSKRKKSSVFAGVLWIVLCLALGALILWANYEDPAPFGMLVFILALLGCFVVGILLALRSRLKEIEGGEIDEARKY